MIRRRKINNMKRVLKQEVLQGFDGVVMRPVGKFLMAEHQRGTLHVWFESPCDTSGDPINNLERWMFKIAATGEVIDDTWIYIDTYTTHNDTFVWHVYAKEIR